MLRVGLTGGLGSGKSTVAAELRRLGAQVIEADELGRAMMQPGQAVYEEIAGRCLWAMCIRRRSRWRALTRGVPGGVGLLTIAMLMANTVRAAKMRRGM